MICAWRSKNFGDFIPFDRIICVKDHTSAVPGMESSTEYQCLIVCMEGGNDIVIYHDEKDSFFKALTTYCEIQDVIAFGGTTEDNPGPKRKDENT